MVAAVMQGTGRPLSELRRSLVKFPQRSVALGVREKIPLDRLSALPEAMRALERELGSRGRVLVRYSGTEPKLRLLVEASSEDQVGAGMERLIAAARSELGPA
jgi:phosphoglucosamine mutase